MKGCRVEGSEGLNAARLNNLLNADGFLIFNEIHNPLPCVVDLTLGFELKHDREMLTARHDI